MRSIAFVVTLAISIFGSIAFATPTQSVKEPFKHFKLVRFDVRSAKQLDYLNSFVENPDYNLDMWTEAGVGPVDVMIPPSSAYLLKIPHLGKIKHTIVMDNLQDVVNEEVDYSSRHSQMLSSALEQDQGLELTAEKVFKDYQDTKTYVAFLETLPGAEKVVIGQSFFNETIYGFKFGSGSKSIVFHGGIQ